MIDYSLSCCVLLNNIYFGGIFKNSLKLRYKYLQAHRAGEACALRMDIRYKYIEWNAGQTSNVLHCYEKDCCEGYGAKCSFK